MTPRMVVQILLLPLWIGLGVIMYLVMCVGENSWRPSKWAWQAKDEWKSWWL